MCNLSVVVVRPLYTMMRDFDNEMLKALKNTCKGCPMEIQKSFYVWTWVIKCNVK